MKSIILAAGVGKRLTSVTEDPKCLLEVGGVTLLERYIRALEKMNILEAVLVIGYKKEMIMEFVKGLNFQGDIELLENPDFTRGSILSLYRARDKLDEDILLMDGDVYFEVEILHKLMDTNQGNLIAIDTTSTSSGEEMMVGVKDGRVLDMKRTLVGNFDIVGETVGFYTFNVQACDKLKKILEEQVESKRYDLGYEDIFPSLFQRVHFEPIIVDGLKWVEIDFEEDVLRARSLAEE